MADKNTSTLSNFDAFMLEYQKMVFDKTYAALAYLAEEAVNRIRDRSSEESWIDHTGNLRSSVGFIITENGRPITTGGFKSTSAPEGNGADGQRKGAEYANSIASQYSRYPIVAIVVAGMEYAVYVEAMENKDVLASVELWVRATWREREPKLRAAIDKAAAKLQKEMGL